MSLKQRIPLLRWSFWRIAAGARNITATGQIGDGREAAAVAYVLEHARAGDIDDVLATIDRFGPEAGTGAGHLLRVRRAAHRPGRARRSGVFR